MVIFIVLYILTQITSEINTGDSLVFHETQNFWLLESFKIKFWFVTHPRRQMFLDAKLNCESEFSIPVRNRAHQDGQLMEKVF